MDPCARDDRFAVLAKGHGSGGQPYPKLILETHTAHDKEHSALGDDTRARFRAQGGYFTITITDQETAKTRSTDPGDVAAPVIRVGCSRRPSGQPGSGIAESNRPPR